METEDTKPYVTVSVTREAGKQASYTANAHGYDPETIKQALESVDKWFTEKYSPQYRPGAQPNWR